MYFDFDKFDCENNKKLGQAKQGIIPQQPY